MVTLARHLASPDLRITFFSGASRGLGGEGGGVDEGIAAGGRSSLRAEARDTQRPVGRLRERCEKRPSGREGEGKMSE